MALISRQDLARMLKLHASQIYKNCTNGKLHMDENKMIDTEHPINATYIKIREVRMERAENANFKKRGPPPGSICLANEKKIAEAVGRGEDPGAISTGSSDEFTVPSDFADLGKHNVDILKTVEQIRGMQVKREKERNELVSRTLTQRVFHKLYIVDTNEFKTLGDKLAPDLAAIAGVDDSEITIQMSQRVEKEVYKILNHIKRIINDFLKKIDAEEIK